MVSKEGEKIKMAISNEIHFKEDVLVNLGNPNGDPGSNDNWPRTDDDGYGLITGVALKRKLRNRLQDMGEDIFVQSEDRTNDGFQSLKDRADNLSNKLKKGGKKLTKEEFTEAACKKWIDVRSFGQVFAFDKKSISAHVKGPVTISIAKSIKPVQILPIQITKSVNGVPGDTKSSDTMGMMNVVNFGVYEFTGSILSVQAEKTGMTDDDVEKIHEALKTIFYNDASAARPDGSMSVIRLDWWEMPVDGPKYSPYILDSTVEATYKGNNPKPTDIKFAEKPLPEGVNADVYKLV